MNDEYEFNPLDFPKISIHLMIEILAFQQAAFAVTVERMKMSEEEKDEITNQINNLVPTIKERITEAAYATFGKTPTI